MDIGQRACSRKSRRNLLIKKERAIGYFDNGALNKYIKKSLK
jgi:hypothetical protein